MESHQKSFLQLPIAPLNNILKRLDINELLNNCCLVSRGFYELITTNPIIIKRIVLKIDNEINKPYNKVIVQALLQSDRVFRCININMLDNSDTVLLLELLKKLGPQIKEITLKEFQPKFPTQSVLAWLPNIETAIIKECHEDLLCLNEQAKMILPPFTHLTTLEITGNIVSSFNQTKSLQHVFYEMSYGALEPFYKIRLTLAVFDKILTSNQSTLKTLIVKGNKLQSYNYKGLNLIKFSMDFQLDHQKTNTDLANFLSYQNELEHLSIKLNFKVGLDLVKVVMHMRQLKSLETNYPEISDNFNYIYVNPNLKTLKLRNISIRGKSSYTDCYQFVNSFPGIKQLDLQLGHPEDIEEGRMLTFAYAHNFDYFRLEARNVLSSVFNSFKWKELTELFIQDCSSRNPIDWTAIVLNNPHVKFLVIDLECNVKNEDYKIIMTNWKLEKLHINNNALNCKKNLDMEGLRIILENCDEKLKKLSVALNGRDRDYEDILAEFDHKLKQIDSEFFYNNKEFTVPYFDAWESIEEDFLFHFP